jgi:2-polyprenyl-3-methyl-5-hydroxy-6-metoxy-1,4-benzoquinol methylase
LDALPELGEAAELGCGSGYFTETIARKCKSIVASDLSDTLLEVARTRLHEHPKVTIQKENCMETTFPPETFDSVFMANLIHVVETPGDAIRECHRILRSGGVIIIVTFTGCGMKLWEKIKMGARFSRAWGRPPSHRYSLSPEQLTSMMEDAEFVVETSKLIGQRTKALYAVGRKNIERQGRDKPGADA